jgi:hypothetical protein
MSKIKRLLDAYKFQGLVPEGNVAGVFGDSRAVVIRLRRRKKRPSAAFAKRCTGLSTTERRDGFGIYRAEIRESTSKWNSVGLAAGNVVA